MTQGAGSFAVLMSDTLVGCYNSKNDVLLQQLKVKKEIVVNKEFQESQVNSSLHKIYVMIIHTHPLQVFLSELSY